MTPAGPAAFPPVQSTPWLSRAGDVLVILLLALTLLPLISGLAIVVQPTGREAVDFWWRDARGWYLLAPSLGFAATGASAGVIAGWVIALTAPRGRLDFAGGSSFALRLALAFTCLPLLVPSSLVGVGWIMAMGRDAVVTNAVRPLFGDWTPTVYDWPVAAAATGLRYAGVAMLVIAASRQESPTARMAEQIFGLTRRARLASRLAATFHAAVAAWILLVLLVQSDHILPGMFLVHTFGTEVLIQFNALMNPAGAAALAIPPALVALGLCSGAARLPRHGGWTASVGLRPDIRDRATLAISKTTVFVLMLSIVVALPLIGIVTRAGGWENLRSAWRGAWPELLHSAHLALAGGAITVLMAIPLAAAWLHQTSGMRSPSMPIVLLNLVVPGSLLALGVNLFPQPSWMRDSSVPLVFTYAVRFVGVAVIVLIAGWVRQSPAADLAGHIHGVPRVWRWLHVTLPRRGPTVVAAFFLVGLLVLAELEISLLLVRPGPTTLGVRLYTLIHTAPDHVVAALATNVLIVTLGVILVGSMLVQLLARLFASESAAEPRRRK